MFDHILVPLDGSALAGEVLEPAVALARALPARLTLVTVINDDVESHFREFARAEGISVTEAVRSYLERTGGRLKEEGIEAGWDLADPQGGSAAERIADLAEKLEASLIAMSTHGRSGVRRVLLGSVAERVLRASEIPVLMVPRRH